ncbi:MAG: DUF2167 domain-containing protein [Alphaproteobacteria bacterium]|nr:DUF2167 domain-containing protein [Alphaproteobacteria bacterium]
MFKIIPALAALCVLALPSLAQLDETPPSPEDAEAAYLAYAEEILAGVTPDHGLMALEGAPVTLSVSEDFDFYSASESRTILEDLWGNPADDSVLGMIFPAGLSPAEAAWGALFTYEESGYVADDDAASTDYDELLADMQAGAREANKERVEQGFEKVELVGWAVPPAYDAAHHRLIWAKDLLFADSDGAHTLNYDMRLLGRHGVLSVNLIAGIDALDDVRAAGPDVLAQASFNPGAAYGDYVKGDKTAGYGVAALIAGGAGVAVLKKTGLIAVLVVILKKAWIVIPFAFAGLWRVVRSLFGGGAKS